MVPPGAHDPSEPAEPAPAAPAADDAASPPVGDTPPAAAPDAEAEALRARVAALEGRERELTERLARSLADYDNMRRRGREEVAQAAGRGKEQLLKALLPTLDNLDRALAHTEDAGLRMIARQLQSALQDQGVQVLAPEGEAFDAKLHEAIASEAREGAKAGTVLAVVEKGYALDGRVLRPARVVVAQ